MGPTMTKNKLQIFSKDGLQDRPEEMLLKAIKQTKKGGMPRWDAKNPSVAKNPQIWAPNTPRLKKAFETWKLQKKPPKNSQEWKLKS